MIFSVYGHPLHDRFRMEGASFDPGAGIPVPAQLHWRRFERRQWRLVLRTVAFMSPLLTGPGFENFVVWLIEGEDGHREGEPDGADGPTGLSFRHSVASLGFPATRF